MSFCRICMAHVVLISTESSKAQKGCNLYHKRHIQLIAGPIISLQLEVHMQRTRQSGKLTRRHGKLSTAWRTRLRRSDFKNSYGKFMTRLPTLPEIPLFIGAER